MENIYGLQSLQHSVPGLSQKAGLTSALWHPYGIEGSQLPLVSTDPGERERMEGCPCILHQASSDLQLLSLFCFTCLTKSNVRSLWRSFTQSPQSQCAPLLSHSLVFYNWDWCCPFRGLDAHCWMLSLWHYFQHLFRYLLCIWMYTHMCTRGQSQVSVIPQKQ